MDILNSGLRALELREDAPTTMTEHTLEHSEALCNFSDSPWTSHFRIYDLPVELRLQILETYVSSLYPRIVYRCFCYLCEPTPLTTLSARPEPHFQREMHKVKYRGSPAEEGATFRRRFSYCEDLPLDSNVRTLNHGSGRNFDFPYGFGVIPPEPGIFVVSKELRQNVIDAVVRTRSFYVFSQDTTPHWCTHKFSEIKYLPTWYREALRFGEELRPCKTTISKLMAGWSMDFPNLREVRLNNGRVRINSSLLSREKMEWVQGVPRDLLENMVISRVQELTQKIWTGYAQGCEQRFVSLCDNQPRDLGSDVSALTLMKSSLERSWKVVVSIEFRIKVRENKRAKRQWASIYVTAREVENCRTYSLDFRLGDRLLQLEQDFRDCLSLVARSVGEARRA